MDDQPLLQALACTKSGSHEQSRLTRRQVRQYARRKGGCQAGLYEWQSRLPTRALKAVARRRRRQQRWATASNGTRNRSHLLDSVYTQAVNALTSQADGAKSTYSFTNTLQLKCDGKTVVIP
eukprot:scaffold161768_cov16-Prasinocladus_malaysianus.AAC.1